MLNGGREPDLEEVAARLKLPTWTLRRKLAEEGTQFRAILNDTRRDLAMTYIRDTELAFGEIAYLLGMMDLVGELKREAVDAIRERRIADAESYYGFMKGIYDSTRALRFASALVPDFRRKQDTARIQIESAAGELAAFGSRNGSV